MTDTRQSHLASIRRQSYVDVSFLLSKGVKPRKIRKALKISGRQFRKAKRANLSFA